LKEIHLMPLSKSKSRAAFRANVEKLVNEGRPVKQAVAISYSIKGEKEEKGMSKKFKIITPSSMLIEKTSAEFAGVFFDAARSSGMTKIKLRGEVINLLKYKNNPRLFAKAHLEKFIPDAVKALIDIMSHPNTPEEQKRIIYDAITERTNDEQLNAMGTQAGLPEFQNTPLFKRDDEKPKPIIINTPRIDFNFNSKKV
jgi:hypothetical protein